MPKPEWLIRREQEVPRSFKRCINCQHKGRPCGLTNNMGKGQGRATLYRCTKHPNITFHLKTYACTDYE